MRKIRRGGGGRETTLTVFLYVKLRHHPPGLSRSTHSCRRHNAVLPIFPVKVDPLQCFNHRQNSALKLRCSIGRDGHKRVAMINQVVINPQPPIPPVLLRSPLLNNKCLSIALLRESMYARLGGRDKEKLERSDRPTQTQQSC